MLSPTFNHLWCFADDNIMWSFTISKSALYIFFIVRLYQVFNGSVYEISKRKAKMMGFLVSIPLILLTIILYTAKIKPIKYLSNPKNKHEISTTIQSFEDCQNLEESFRTDSFQRSLAIGVSIYILNEIIYSIVILRLFIRRVLMISNATDAKHEDIMVGKENSKKNIKRKLFLYSIVKLTNLTILAIISNYIALIKYGAKWPLYTLNIDAICNCASVFLSLKSSQKIYDNTFYFCHAVCYKCCARLCYCCCLPGNKEKRKEEEDKIKKEMELHTKINTNLSTSRPSIVAVDSNKSDIYVQNGGQVNVNVDGMEVHYEYGQMQDSNHGSMNGQMHRLPLEKVLSASDDLESAPEQTMGHLHTLGSLVVGTDTLGSGNLGNNEYEVGTDIDTFGVDFGSLTSTKGVLN